MTKRKSFILHNDSLDILSELTDEQAGQLFKAISSYQLTGEHELKGVMNALFIPFRNQFDRDDEKYQSICERNRNNGLKGGRKKPKETQSQTLGKKLTQENPKEPDNKSKSKSKSKNEVSINTLSVSHVEDWLIQKRVCGKYLTIDEHRLLEKFKDYCIGNGKTYKDYVAAFRNSFEWSNAPKKGNNNGQPTRTQSADVALQNVLADYA